MAADTYAGTAGVPSTDHVVMSGELGTSGVSWGAIIAGAVAAAAVTLILFFLGAGLGLTAISPWSNRADQQSAFAALGVGVIVWSFIIHIVAFGVGGYMAGRLRTRWGSLHRDESYFRDTAHGFLAWALGSLVSFCIIALTAGHVARDAGAAAAHGAGAMAGMAGEMSRGLPGMAGGPAGGPQETLGYFIDTMMRPGTAQGGATQGGGSQTGQATATAPAPGAIAAPPLNGQSGPAPLDPQTRGEISRVVVTSLANGSVSQPDKDYLAQIVASRTGLSQQDASKRVDDTFTQIQAAIQKATDKAKEFADNARKAAIGFTLWTFAALLVGAFSAALAGLWGGRARDLY